MNVGYVLDLSREVIWTLVEVASPLLIISYNYFHSGADSDVRAKVSGHYAGTGFMWGMDIKYSVGFIYQLDGTDSGLGKIMCTSY